jgi:hypothetical protein
MDVGDHIRNKIGKACGMCEEEQNCLQGFLGGEYLRDRDCLKDLGVDGRIIVKR